MTETLNSKDFNYPIRRRMRTSLLKTRLLLGASVAAIGVATLPSALPDLMRMYARGL